MKKITYCLTGILLSSLCITASFGQFSINETFKNSTVGSGITLGGGAYLTSGTSDPEGEGWLRLTEDANNQAGYAVIQQAFPSAMGVLIDFEYTTWSTPGEGSGADGISLFLFDATRSDSFHVGGYGGSLGYSKRNDAPGLTGGYMGIGLDEFGNYSNPTEGRVGGPGFIKNAIALRGPAPDYAYLGGNQVIESDNGTGDNGGIDYNTTTATRPTEAQFYRRVQISLEPQNGTYTVTVKWKKSASAPFVTLFGPVAMTSPPPSMLKLGLAASTGAQHNFHEIRNMIITTPGNISVDKQGPAYLPASSSHLSYDITVSNQTAVTVNDILIRDLLPPGYSLSADTGITVNTYGNGSSSVSNITVSNGVLSAQANIAPNSEITLRLNGTISNTTAGQSIRNTVKISTNSIQDADTTNNADTVYTLVQAPLPVTLSYFQATPDAGDVLLRWATGMEINCDRFEIERSTDGRYFTSIAMVKSEGDHQGQRLYELKDNKALEQPAAMLYYRLKQTDRDGRSEYSTIRQLAVRHADAFALYPIPFSNALRLQVQAAENGQATVNFYSADGRCVYRSVYAIKKGANDLALDEAAVSLPAGVYFLEYINGRETIRRKVTRQ